mgnify:CR=1 FL=1
MIKYYDAQQWLRERQPKLLYTVTNFQNPSGISYSDDNRRGVADLVRGRSCLIIQDDPYGDLRFSVDENLAQELDDLQRSFSTAIGGLAGMAKARKVEIVREKKILTEKEIAEILDPAAWRVRATVKVGTAPHWIAASADTPALIPQISEKMVRTGMPM